MNVPRGLRMLGILAQSVADPRRTGRVVDEVGDEGRSGTMPRPGVVRHRSGSRAWSPWGCIAPVDGHATALTSVALRSFFSRIDWILNGIAYSDRLQSEPGKASMPTLHGSCGSDLPVTVSMPERMPNPNLYRSAACSTLPPPPRPLQCATADDPGRLHPRAPLRPDDDQPVTTWHSPECDRRFARNLGRSPCAVAKAFHGNDPSYRSASPPPQSG